MILKPSPTRIGAVLLGETGVRIASALAGVLLSVVAGHLALSRGGGSLVMASYDLPFLAHRAGGASDLCLVHLDALDGELLDRRVQARLLDRLDQAGAAMVLYDVVFDAPAKDPAIDVEFAAAMRRFRGVDGDGNALPGRPARKVLLACERKTFAVAGAAGEQLVPPTDLLLEAADDFGLVTVDDDAYMVRKLPAGTIDEASLIWKAAIAAGAKLDDARRLDPRWLNFAGPPPDPEDPASVPAIASIGAAAVLDGSFHPGFFRDKIVLVGGEPGILGAELGKDLFATPFHRFQPGGKRPLMGGLELQANGLANLLQGNWLVRAAPRFEAGLIALTGLLVGAGLTLLRPMRGVLVALILCLLAALSGVLAVHHGQCWFAWTVPAFVQIPVALVWGVGSQSYLERLFRIRLTREQAAIREAFSKYLSPQMLDRLTRDGFRTNLGGEKIHAAIMFTDLEDFTTLCERIGDPERIVATLNRYFERATGSIFDDEGIIVKFIGDAIFAAWGTPVPEPDAPHKAIRSAWNLYSSDRFVVDGETLRTRIGLHYGEVVAGNIGSTKRVDFTLIGDSVNLASRLEGMNKMLGTGILMSAAMRVHLDESAYRARRVGRFRVKGKADAVEVHELLGFAAQANEPAWITVFHAALEAFERGDGAAARDGFATADQLRPGGDGPARFFLGFIAEHGIPVDGVVKLTEK